MLCSVAKEGALDFVRIIKRGMEEKIFQFTIPVEFNLFLVVSEFVVQNVARLGFRCSVLSFSFDHNFDKVKLTM